MAPVIQTLKNRPEQFELTVSDDQETLETGPNPFGDGKAAERIADWLIAAS